jgi:hypothetical protein
MTTELFQAGDRVPRSWFSKLEKVADVIFVHPCLVETTESGRAIRKAEPVIAGGSMILFTPDPDSDGRMIAEFDRETTLINS